MVVVDDSVSACSRSRVDAEDFHVQRLGGTADVPSARNEARSARRDRHEAAERARAAGRVGHGDARREPARPRVHVRSRFPDPGRSVPEAPVDRADGRPDVLRRDREREPPPDGAGCRKRQLVERRGERRRSRHPGSRTTCPRSEPTRRPRRRRDRARPAGVSASAPALESFGPPTTRSGRRAGTRPGHGTRPRPRAPTPRARNPRVDRDLAAPALRSRRSGAPRASSTSCRADEPTPSPTRPDALELVHTMTPSPRRSWRSAERRGRRGREELPDRAPRTGRGIPRRGSRHGDHADRSRPDRSHVVRALERELRRDRSARSAPDRRPGLRPRPVGLPGGREHAIAGARRRRPDRGRDSRAVDHDGRRSRAGPRSRRSARPPATIRRPDGTRPRSSSPRG